MQHKNELKPIENESGVTGEGEIKKPIDLSAIYPEVEERVDIELKPYDKIGGSLLAVLILQALGAMVALYFSVTMIMEHTEADRVAFTRETTVLEVLMMVTITFLAVGLLFSTIFALGRKRLAKGFMRFTLMLTTIGVIVMGGWSVYENLMAEHCVSPELIGFVGQYVPLNEYEEVEDWECELGGMGIAENVFLTLLPTFGLLILISIPWTYYDRSERVRRTFIR